MIRRAVLATLLPSTAGTAVAAQVNIYLARKEALIKPLLHRFTEQTGIATNLVTGNADALLKPLRWSVNHEAGGAPSGRGDHYPPGVNVTGNDYGRGFPLRVPLFAFPHWWQSHHTCMAHPESNTPVTSVQKLRHIAVTSCAPSSADSDSR